MKSLVALCCLLSLVCAKDYKPNLLQLAESLNLNQFVSAVRQCGLHKIINHEGMFTIFAPSDEAFAREKTYPGEDKLCDKISMHIGWGNIKKADVQNEMTTKTLLSKRTIRINVYGDVVAANGRKVSQFDNEARNGILHVIDDVMSSVYQRAGSVISEMDECCPQHSEMVELVKLAGLYNMLDTQGPFTLLTPNNGAFEKLHPDFIHHLKKNRTALANLLSAHVLPGTTYSVGLSDGMSVKTVAGNTIKVRIDGQDVKFGKGTVTLMDVTAGNGAVHAIDEVLFPTSGRYHRHHKSSSLRKLQQQNLADLCRTLGYTSFADALKATKLDKVVDHEGHFTILAPTNEAFDHPQSYPKQFSLVDKVRFHIARGLIKESKVVNEVQVPTLLSKRFVKFNVYQKENKTVTTANGRVVIFTGHEAYNGIVHELKTGMDYIYGRDGTLHEELSQLPQFTSFVNLMDMHFPGLLKHASSFTLTLLAPPNRVLDSALEREDERKVAEMLLMNHFLPNTWYTEGMKLVGQVVSLGGREIQVTQKGDTLLLNGIPLDLKDCTVKNGAFHQIEDLL